jgi:quercetin 2,3-dioxygenase
VVVRAMGGTDLRALVIGGEPLRERIVMWWNFVGRDHDEIVAFRGRWQTDGWGRRDPDGAFGLVRGYDGDPLPAPELPTVRLAPRG